MWCDPCTIQDLSGGANKRPDPRIGWSCQGFPNFAAGQNAQTAIHPYRSSDGPPMRFPTCRIISI
jgi:hypothetical protein